MTRAARTRNALILALLALAAGAGALPAGAAGAAAADLLQPARAALAAARADLARAPAGSQDEARLAFLAGDFARARRVLDARVERDTTDFEAVALRARLDLTEYRYGGFHHDLQCALALGPNHPDTRRLLYRDRFFCDDLGSVERRFQGDLQADSTDPVALLYAARFEHLTLRFDRAIAAYQRALRHAADGPDSVRCLSGLGACWLQKGDKDAALRYQTRAVALGRPDDDLLVDLANTLIKLGRAYEAMDALELATEINPCSENAHYLLGNGYARLNYAELRVQHPGALADSATAPALRQADSLFQGGQRGRARARLVALLAEHPGCADAHNHLGSYAYEACTYEGVNQPASVDTALAEFREALRRCPGYGRAHNGIARSLEMYRRLADVHADQYEREFQAAAWPEIPEIERFVLNYSTLSPRMQKRVALSVAPWKAYVPVLAEGGATLYIKHLHELLSACPGQQALRDRRIDYDLRLWDDVRGCGGYHTVTGIEDVEGSLLGKYNTLLHELTHQVHGVLTADLTREIQELYRRARARMDAGQEAFVSLYQASSVYEYLAEGANAWYSPQRDRFDTREMTRERLVARDTALVHEILKLTSITDVAPFYAVAYSGAGDDRLERGQADSAVSFYRKAQARDPGSEDVAARLSYGLSLLGRNSEAVAVADSGLARHPASASLRLQRISAEFVRTGNRAAELAALEAARAQVDPRERYRADADLGRAALDEGRIEEARAGADSVLAYQSDNPEGLELRGELEAAAGRADSAGAYFDRAVRVRSGWLGLRVAYASALLVERERAPQAAGAEALLAAAAAQVAGARLVDPVDPRVALLDGWLALDRGDLAAARKALDSAVEQADWLDLARILRARVRAAQGDGAGARAELAPIEARLARPTPPRYLYNPRQSGYELVGELGWLDKEQCEVARKSLPPR